MSGNGSRDLASADRPIFEKLPGESRQAYANFAHYRDLTPTRSIARAAKDLGKTAGNLEQQSRKYRWQERVNAYDEHVDRIRRAAYEDDVVRMRRSYLAAVAKGKVGVLDRIGGNEEAEVERADPNELDFRQAFSVLREMQVIEHTAMGLPTDVLRGSFQIAAADFRAIVRDLTEIALRFVPDELKSRYAAELEAYVATGRLGW